MALIACNRQQARDRIKNRQAFGIRNPQSPTGFSFQGNRVGDDYVVKSYGVTIGVYYGEFGTWQLSSEKYSVTTSRHQSILAGAAL